MWEKVREVSNSSKNLPDLESTDPFSIVLSVIYAALSNDAFNSQNFPVARLGWLLSCVGALAACRSQ